MQKENRKKTKQKKYNDQYRHVVLRLWSKNLDPDEITKTLGIEPTSSWRKGKIKGKSGKEYKKPYGQWNLESGLRRNTRFERQILDIFKQIKNKKEIMKQILENTGADLVISVQPYEEIAVWSYGFKAEVLNEFTSLGIDIRFVVHLHC